MAREALKALSRKIPTYQELSDLFESIKSDENDRAVGVLAAELVSDALQDAIMARMIELDATEKGTLFYGLAPIATFSSRTKIAYALGIFGSNLLADIDCIRDIRNALAHGRAELNFNTDAVKAACMSLQNPTASKPFEPADDARYRYIETTEKICYDLIGETYDITRPKAALP